MKIIAFYLPQFHRIPENDEWWGEGFTEWTNVKKAKPLFRGHNQPRVPLNENYYNLLNKGTIQWQINLAKKYGVYGFCFYHYWFNGHLLLEKPVELFLKNPDLDINFCICWANEHWTKAWVSNENKVLIEQKYGGEEDWNKHFEYLLPFLKDNRYIRVDEKPLIVIYRPEIIDKLSEMISFFKKKAIENGLKGIAFAYQHPSYFVYPKKDDSLFDYYIEYQPVFATTMLSSEKHSTLRKIKRRIGLFFEKHFNIVLELGHKKKVSHRSYDETWDFINNYKPESSKAIAGAFVDWDNTPRRVERGTVYDGSNPEKFKCYLSKQIKNCKNNYKNDMLFMFAWNEWGEGGYLEPDTTNGHGMLESIKEALEENGEFPHK